MTSDTRAVEAASPQPVQARSETGFQEGVSLLDEGGGLETRLLPGLQRANLPPEAITAVLTALKEEKKWSGKVSRIVTTADSVTKVVTNKKYFPDSVAFKFPPNDEKFDAELKRAQDHGLSVEVGYHPDAKTPEKIIDWVVVSDSTVI